MALTYKSKLLPVSFRGVKFGLTEISTSRGRRTVLHEYPGRDDPYTEDLGRKAQEYSVSGFVMCKDNYDDAEALIAALEAGTPGTFVHPSKGPIQVMVGPFTHRYSNQIGGIEYFNITFIETAGNTQPSVTADTQSQVRISVSNHLATSSGYFTENFDTVGYPDFIAEAATQNVNAFVDKFRGILNFGSAQNGNPSNYSRLIERLNQFQQKIPTLITTPKDLADQINSLNSDLNASFAGNLTLAMLMQARLYEYGDNLLIVIPTTNLREVEKINQDQLIYLIKNSAVAMMVRNAGQMTFASGDDAIAQRDFIDEKAWVLLDTLANNFADDIYRSLSDVITSMVTDIRIRSANSAMVRTYTIADSMPSLVLAYEFLDDSTQNEALTARNKVANPMFVPAHSDVKVVVPNV